MRKTININKGWKFSLNKSGRCSCPNHPGLFWKTVNLPHTWNNLDGQDGGFDYYRGKCFYMTAMSLHLDADEEAYLEFKGANAVAEVYVNSVLVCTHKGGFSTFRCNITPFIRNGYAEIGVVVDNSESNEVYPQTADFTFFGGLYRDVNLIIVNKCRFSLDYYGSDGVFVTLKINENGTADVKVDILTDNLTSDCRIEAETDGMIQNGDCKTKSFTFKIDNPHLWNGRKDPNLYKLKVKIICKDKILDSIVVQYGIRSFNVDSCKGFYLNGNSYPLHGVSRHQDRKNMGWAITKEEHAEDMKIICEVGANTIRLAHYQHSQDFYNLCDNTGMAVWAEIPFISSFMKGSAARENTLSQMRELVLQNYNHPSIICWGISNEITIGGEDEELTDNLHALNNLCHELDKTRPTTMANLTMVENNSILNRITDIVSYNHYFGWYMGSVEDNGPWLDSFHEENPDICLGLSEYGSEGIIAYHNDEPKMQDYSEEYQSCYHEKMLETISERPYLWSTHVWNMFDFASDMRDEGGVKGMNNKGLVTYDRKIKKDSFYIYKAYWSDEPFVHICSSRYVNRASERINIKVYSNCKSVSLYVNGNNVGQLIGDKIFVFSGVKLRKGINTIKVTSDECQDFAEFNYVEKPDESYIFSGHKSGESISNWFSEVSSDAEMQFSDGYFSINDKIGDIMKTPDGEKFINDMIEKVSAELNMTVSKGMLNMGKSFTVRKVIEMAGDRVPHGIENLINSELQKISK